MDTAHFALCESFWEFPALVPFDCGFSFSLLMFPLLRAVMRGLVLGCAGTTDPLAGL